MSLNQYDVDNVEDHSVGKMRFWVEPGGERPYVVDLSEFDRGGRLADQSAMGQKHWGGDFIGRPKFAREIADYYRLVQPNSISSRAIRTALRSLFRFLDVIEEGSQVQSVCDLRDAHGPMLKRHFGYEVKNVSTYKTIKTTIDRMRDLNGARPLFWPARNVERLKIQEDVDVRGARRLYNALKAEGRCIKQMFAEGSRLSAQGEDPRGSKAQEGFSPAAWHVRANHAWLIHEVTQTRLCSKTELYAVGCMGLNKANDPATQLFDGPEYLAPGMTERGRQGIVGKLRWFHPSYHDTAIFLWLFLLGTGWNLTTALSLDVSENSTWVQDHPHKQEFKILHGFKSRSDRHVFTLSLKKPEWHPYQIVRFMIDRTGPLRATLRHRLAEAEKRYMAEPTPAVRAEIEHLRTASRSPWLYHVVNKIGEVNAFSNHDSAKLNDIARIVAEAGGLLGEHPSLATFGTSIARDAWIGYAYAKSGHAVIFAELAAQHADARQLKHYLNRLRFRAYSEKMVRLVQNGAFEEIRERRPLDPTRLHLLVREGRITPEQERRLIDLRQRTRLGMGCLEPRNPPREVAPDHREGAICRIQRCTGCPHGVVMADSLPALTRARAELLHIRREIPLAAWSGSSFDDELQSIEATLESFNPAAVSAHTDAWTAKLRSGEIIAHETYPSY